MQHDLFRRRPDFRVVQVSSHAGLLTLRSAYTQRSWASTFQSMQVDKPEAPSSGRTEQTRALFLQAA